MYRVSPATGLPAGAGEPAIWEGYKPGTEPGQRPRCRNLQPARRSIADARASPWRRCGEPAGAGDPGPPSAHPRPIDAPAGGTGGLY